VSTTAQRFHEDPLSLGRGIFPYVITDPLPRTSAQRRQYEASDARLTLPLPPAALLQPAARALEAALAAGDRPAVKRAGERLLAVLAENYSLSRPDLSVLGARPRRVVGEQYAYELFGDYSPDTQKIRVWMRTAVLGKVTSYRGLLNTLLHEFCHHLDVRALGWPGTPHTRGFFTRIDALYHLALDTPLDKRRPLHWIKHGSIWRIDWRRLRG
jgi:hypothetical protein